MEFVDGYFGIAKKFEWTARNTKFMKGFGLPGMVWASGMPVLAENMLNSSTFLRAEDARRIGINKGLGIPCSDGTGRMFVMNLVSAMGLPIARRFEIWVPSSDSAGLVFLEGECDINKNFADDYAGVMLERYSGVLSHAWTTGIPAVSGDVAVQAAPAVRASAEKAGLKEMLAIPVMVDGKARALVAMYY